MAINVGFGLSGNKAGEIEAEVALATSQTFQQITNAHFKQFEL